MKYVLITSFLVFFVAFSHPYYLSVTDLKYSVRDKALQGSVKLFTSDIENALKKINKKPVDLINVKDSSFINGLLKSYLFSHLNVNVNGRARAFDFIGFEREEEAVWIYIEYRKCEIPKKIEIKNSLLFDFIKDQINIVQVEVNTTKKSSKSTNPEQNFVFDFK